MDIVIKRNWWAVAVRGVLAILFGIVLLVWPAATTVVLILLFGIFAILEGVLGFIQTAVAVSQDMKWIIFALKGLLGLVVGVVVLARPGVALVAVLVAIAIWLIASGFIDIVAAADLPKEIKGRWLFGISGVLSVLVGLLLLVFPALGIFSIILFLGIFSIVAGVLFIILGFMISGLWKEMEAGSQSE